MMIFDILDEDACLDPNFPDLMDEAALEVGIGCALIAAMGGALSSTSQLHYLRSVKDTRPHKIHLTLKNSPSVEL